MVFYLRNAKNAIESVIDDKRLSFVASELAGVLYFIRLGIIDIQKQPELVATNDFVRLTIVINRAMEIITTTVPDFCLTKEYIAYYQASCTVHLQTA